MFARLSREEQVVKARSLMSTLGIDWVSLHRVAEFFGAAYENPKLTDMIKLMERDYGILVYYVTHEHTSFGECYSFLYVSSYAEDLEHHNIRFSKTGEEMIALAWVWNISAEHCSEFGSVVLKNDHGCLVRVS